MGEFKDRAKGAVDETVGKAKRAMGDATDNPKLQAEGDIQETKGNAETVLGKVKGVLKD